MFVLLENKTRIIHLARGTEREYAANNGTRVVLFDEPLARASFRDVFVRNYERIRRVCTRFARPGIAAIAADVYTQEFRGSMCLAAKRDGANAAIIGRHSMADLFLADDESMSLRHVALVLAPLSAGRDVRFHVIDLRSSVAFCDERDHTFEALVAEGPLFITCGGYALLFLPTGDDIFWPESAEDGWACVPERVYLEEREAEPDRWRRAKARQAGARGRARTRSGDEVTVVTSVPGPIHARGRLITDQEHPLGALHITSAAGAAKLLVGPEAARRGVLLGRSSRCDLDADSVLVAEGISRVHLLVIRVGADMYAIDTGSTNGTRLASNDHEARIALMHDSQELVLGEDLARVRWVPAG